MDFGYHNALQRSMLLYNSCLENGKMSHQSAIDCIVKCVQELDPNKDKQSFLLSHRSAFSPSDIACFFYSYSILVRYCLMCCSTTFALPKKFEYQPHRGDEVSLISAQKPVQDDLVLRYQQLNNRLDTLKLENEEVRLCLDYTLTTRFWDFRFLS